jgi:cytochrome c-type biogenesis protein CcmH
MLTFWLIAAGMTVLILVLVLRPLVTRAGPTASAEEEKRLAVYRQQFKELEQDHANAVLTDDQFQVARRELERRLLEEAGTVEGAAPGFGLPVNVKTLAAGLAALLPLISVALYLKLGTPLAITHPGAPSLSVQEGAVGAGGSMGGLDALTERLKKRLEENPADGRGWALLARAYAELGRYADAVPVFEKAVQLIPDDAQLLADYADVIGVTQGRRLSGKPEALIEQALKADPQNIKALLLAGTVAYNKKEFSRAAALWEKAQMNLPADAPPEARQELSDGIAEARQLAGEKAPPTATAKAGSPPGPAAAAQAVSPRAITGTVNLAPNLAAKGSANDTLFVFAREMNGPPMPVAIVRATKKDLPFSFRLDDSNSPMPARKLSQVGSVVIVARLSKSGEAMPKSGDLQGMSQPLKPGMDGVRVTIDQEIP